MERVIRILAGLAGLLMTVQGLRWIVDPAAQAESLGMPLLDGVARSTQVGDLAAFFLAAGGFGIYGAWRRQRAFLFAAAVLLGGAATMRTLTALLHDAPFATQFIVPEVVMTVIFGAAARELDGR